MRKTPIIPLEHDEQVKVIDWCNVHHVKYPMLKWIFAIPNAAKRSWKVGREMKAEGVKKGVPDLCLPYPTRFLIDIEGGDLTLYHGLYIEMKRKGNTTTADQKEWLDYLEYVGYKTAVAYSGDEAIKIIEEYVK
jgi:hypothetical protein